MKLKQLKCGERFSADGGSYIVTEQSMIGESPTKVCVNITNGEIVYLNGEKEVIKNETAFE